MRQAATGCLTTSWTASARHSTTLRNLRGYIPFGTSSFRPPSLVVAVEPHVAAVAKALALHDAFVRERRSVARDIPLHLGQRRVLAVRVEIRLHRKRERCVVEIEPAINPVLVKLLAAEERLVDVLDRLVDERPVDHCTDIANADFLMRTISPASILVNPKHFLPKSFSDAPIR